MLGGFTLARSPYSACIQAKWGQIFSSLLSMVIPASSSINVSPTPESFFIANASLYFLMYLITRFPRYSPKASCHVLLLLEDLIVDLPSCCLISLRKLSGYGVNADLRGRNVWFEIIRRALRRVPKTEPGINFAPISVVGARAFEGTSTRLRGVFKS